MNTTSTPTTVTGTRKSLDLVEGQTITFRHKNWSEEGEYVTGTLVKQDGSWLALDADGKKVGMCIQPADKIVVKL